MTRAKGELLESIGEFEYSVCPSMDIISQMGVDQLINYRVNWEKIYEIEFDGQFGVVYKKDGKFFIVVDKEMNLNVYDTNEGRLTTSITNSRALELISWSESVTDTGSNNEFGDRGIEYIEKCLPSIPSVLNSILEQKHSFDFIVYGGANQLNISIFGIFSIENLIKLDGTFMGHVTDGSNIAENYILAQLDQDLAIHSVQLGFLNQYPNLNALTLISSKISKYFAQLQLSFNSISSESQVYVTHSRKVVGLLEDESLQYVDELLELLLTGMFSKGVHIWLTDYLGEAGLTRWQGVLRKSMEKIRSIVFTSIIPLIERLILNYTNFTQLLTNKKQDQITGKLQSLLRQVYSFITDLNTESYRLNKFIEWLQLLLKDLNEDFTDERKQDILNSISTVDTGEISNYLKQGLNSSCITKFTDPQSVPMSLTRDLKVFINAKFSILKMEIKKNVSLANTFTIPNMNIEYLQHLFYQHKAQLFVVVLDHSDSLTLYCINPHDTTLASVTQSSVKFEQSIRCIKVSPSQNILFVLLQDKIITLHPQTLKEMSRIPIEVADFAATDLQLNLNLFLLSNSSHRYIQMRRERERINDSRCLGISDSIYI